jgi:CheY-like chemotaxis protein
MAQVLIVDDQSDIRRLLSISLGKSYDILESEDGQTALDMVQQHSPRVVLLDVMMPGAMNGLEVLAAIKSNPLTAHIAVAIVSARGQPHDTQQADDFGADAYFIKPFSPMQVVAWVREQIG